MPDQPMRRAGILIFLALFVSGWACRAQVLTPDIPLNRMLILAEEQYDQGHYAMAAQSARQYLAECDDAVKKTKLGEVDKAKYLEVISSLKAGAQGADSGGVAYLHYAVNHAYRQRVMFSLAQYYFRHGAYDKAIPMYEGLSVSNLDNSEVADEKFELAYCYFNNREFDKAKPKLFAIKEIKEGKYYEQANYYYGLIVYNENKYAEALQSFERIRTSKDYKGVVSYYIAEIYYFMGQRNKALKLADTLINSPEKSIYNNELHLLAAQCVFEDQHFEDAIPYFEYYYDHAEKIRKEELYEFAYCYYKTGAWANAISKFKMLSDARDTLGQTAMYLLGDCYLKTGDKKSARNAFGICADMTFNPGQQEASMILFAKTSYETGFSNDALRSLDTLLQVFPHTHYRDEANTIISDLLLKTNNFSGALEHLGQVKQRNDDYKAVYQKACFGYATLKFRDGNLDSALYFFNRSLDNPVNVDYEAAAYFWKGELAYHEHHYDDVTGFTQKFISKRGNRTSVTRISPLATLQHAYLNLGYAAMDLQDFASAQNYFALAQSSDDRDAYSGNVAALKEADAVFMQKNYSRAIVLYDKIIRSDSVNADYARYQKSILLGLVGRNDEKITVLKGLIYEFPPSTYASYARYEIAITYIELDKYEEALPYLHELTDSAGDKSFAPKSWMKIGFIHQQLNEINLAINAYKRVLIDYPASDERMPAIQALKNLYIQSNQPAAFTQMLKDNNLPSADSGSIDSTYYAAAENLFTASKTDEAKAAFTNYLQQYPNGIFALRAHYYRAECNYQLKKFFDARQDYKVILNGPWNEFKENSALRAAVIAYEQQDYAGAFGYYGVLRSVSSEDQTKEEAIEGLMKSGFNSGKPDEALRYADTLLCTPGISEETIEEGLFYKAKSLQQADSAQAATRIFKQLSGNKNDAMAAESRYQIALILFNGGKLKDAENAANESIHLSSGFDYWIVKSYILLADILAKQKDYFNAKATLESIVKHSAIPELKEEAEKKLAEVKKAEKQKSKLSDE